MSKNSSLVYSTETGRICPDCGQPAAACACKAAAKAAVIGDGMVRVSRQKRAGKTVTLAKGLPLPADELASLGKQLRTACGAGGTVKDGVIEIQGDHVDTVMAALDKLGHKPKRSGG